MIEVFLALLLGMVVGSLLYRRKIQFPTLPMDVILGVLMVLMGSGVAQELDSLAQISLLGTQAMIIALGSILGSLLFLACYVVTTKSHV